MVEVDCNITRTQPTLPLYTHAQEEYQIVDHDSELPDAYGSAEDLTS